MEQKETKIDTGKADELLNDALREVHVLVTEAVLNGVAEPHLGQRENIIDRLERALEVITKAGILPSPLLYEKLSSERLGAIVSGLRPPLTAAVGETQERIVATLRRTATEISRVLRSESVANLRSLRYLSRGIRRYSGDQITMFNYLASTEDVAAGNGGLPRSRVISALTNFHRMSLADVEAAVKAIRSGSMPK